MQLTLLFVASVGRWDYHGAWGGRGLVVVGTLVAGLTPPSPMGRWENGKKWEKREKGKKGREEKKVGY